MPVPFPNKKDDLKANNEINWKIENLKKTLINLNVVSTKAENNEEEFPVIYLSNILSTII